MHNLAHGAGRVLRVAEADFDDINKIYEDRVELEFDSRYKWRMTDVAP